jgi:carbamoyl-phosphate synthase large subunit
MKSTGEVMGIDSNFQAAIAKALLASGFSFHTGDSVLLSISDTDKVDAVQLIRSLIDSDCKLYATEGTAAMIQGLGLPVTLITKRLSEGHPNVIDVITDGTVDAVINTFTGERAPMQDGFQMRRAAVERRIPCFTSLDTARAAVENLINGVGAYNVLPRNAYLNRII